MYTAKEKRKEKEQSFADGTMMAGSDEEQFYDETIQLIAKHSESGHDAILFDPDS